MDTTNAETQAPVITLSEAALKEVKRLINVQGLTEGGLRLGVKGGGCSGLSYTINFDEKIGEHDQVMVVVMLTDVFVDVDCVAEARAAAALHAVGKPPVR
ncbi:MAG: HesB/IscA family protein, partial [Nitrospirales bacterium]